MNQQPEQTWYYLDPDYRRDAPESGPYCVRCQKPMKANVKGITYRSVAVNWDTMEVKNDPFGKYLIGSDCWNQITKKPKP